jgi:hypothetical protein
MIGVIAAASRKNQPIIYPDNVSGFTAIYKSVAVCVGLTWNSTSISSGSISHYVIDKRVVGDSLWDHVTIEIGLSYNDYNILSSTGYEYRIKAVSDLGVQSQFYATDTVIIP